MMKWVASIVRVLFLGLFLYLILAGNMFLWLALFGASLIAAILFGRVYCGYACPMNTVMIPVEWISKKLSVQTSSIPNWLKNGILPWAALGISIIITILSKRALHINLPVLFIWLAVSLLVTLRYKPEVFHNYICPFGALQKVFGRALLFSKKVDVNSCIGCKKCEKVCPSHAITVHVEDKKAQISKPLCHQCSNCSNACPVSAIAYKRSA
ncbi:MAG TPA: 4Fe-4S binding protein [Bacillota bacterium]|nr:4Fe-4S binding protein [Bacillota bacterium]